jgi:hypothetical protein
MSRSFDLYAREGSKAADYSFGAGSRSETGAEDF